MYRYILPAVAVAFVIMVITGCTETTVSDLQNKPGETATAEDQARAIKEAAKAGVDEALEASRREEAAKKPDRGPHPLVRDLAVARELVARAQQTDDQAAIEGYVGRLRNVLTAMLAESPASVIVTHIERAGLAITLQQPTEAQLRDASAEIMAALDASFGVQPTELVPAVLTKLESAKDMLSKGDAQTARSLLDDARTLASDHAINRHLRGAAAAADGAGVAIKRGAAAVVKAELEEVARLLEEVARVAVIEAEPTPTAEPVPGVEGEQTTTEGATPQAGSAGAAEGTTESTAAAGAAGAGSTATTPAGTTPTDAQPAAAGTGSTPTVPPPPAPSR
ncbi:MAG TPA: hypothetical protein DGT21_19760 [Armatimonadetes bacterium]|nr:hypothetical protein [Armatimonadota bacterium]